MLVEKLSSLRKHKCRKYTAPLGHHYQNCGVGTIGWFPSPLLIFLLFLYVSGYIATAVSSKANRCNVRGSVFFWYIFKFIPAFPIPLCIEKIILRECTAPDSNSPSGDLRAVRKPPRRSPPSDFHYENKVLLQLWIYLYSPRTLPTVTV